MSARYVDVAVRADPDLDDCLAGAEAAYIDEHPALRGYDLSPRWADDERETITLSVPEWATRVSDVVSRITTPHEFALANGWDATAIEATAKLGVSEDDQARLAETEVTPDELLVWCRERVSEAP